MRPSAPLPTPPDGPRRHRIGRVLALLGRGVIAFHPRLITLTGSITSALMLSQSLYWTKVVGRNEGRDGWFWKTRADWHRETALSRHEQDGARARLSALPFWRERRVGMPARLWFKVDLNNLARQIDQDFTGSWDWQDERALMHLLGRPLLVYRALADLCGSVTASILLSRLLAEERVALRAQLTRPGQSSVGWVRYDQQRLLAATGLTRAEFYHARAVLRAAGFVSERRIGLPPRSEWRLDLEAIASVLEAGLGERNKSQTSVIHSPDHAVQHGFDFGAKRFDQPETRVVDQLAGIRTFSMWQNHIQGCGKTPYKDAENPQTGNPDFGQLDFAIPANKMAEFRTPGRPESVRPIEGLTTGKPITSKPLPLTPTAPEPVSLRETAGVGGSEKIGNPLTTLVWPSALLETERPIALTLLCSIPSAVQATQPHLAQQLLDELAGQAAQRLIHQPLAYLRRLVERVQLGSFVPVTAARICEARQRAEQRQRERENLGLVPETKPPVSLTPEQRAARRRDLEAMSKKLGLHVGLRPVVFPQSS